MRESHASVATLLAEALSRLLWSVIVVGCAPAAQSPREPSRPNAVTSVEALIYSIGQGNEQARRTAYLDLWKRGYRAPAPEPQVGQCIDARAPAVLACDEALTVCYDLRSLGGSGGGTDIVFLRVGTKGKSPFEDDAALDIAYKAVSTISSKACAYEWDLRPDWYAALVRRCALRRHSEEDCEAALRAVLGPATEANRSAAAIELAALTPAEKLRAEREQAECNQRRRAEELANSGFLCVPIIYDPCRKRIGVVCDTARADGEESEWFAAPGPSPRPIARELQLGAGSGQ